MRPTVFTSTDALVPFAKARSMRRLYNGIVDAPNRRLIDICTHEWHVGLSLRVILVYTRDVGHHTSGWWKNPDYERCLHLSVSYRDLMTDESLPHDKRRTADLAAAFFGDDARLSWIEPPATEHGKIRDVWHYRLFCDEGWQPMLPHGEVYSKNNTPADWKSFSEIHGFKPEPEQAPFLLNASDSA